MSKKINQALFSLLGFALLIAILFLIQYLNPFFNQDKELTTITFSPKWVNQAQFAGIFVAKELGYYNDEGIDLIIEEFEAGDSVLSDLKSGESQLGLMSANELLLNYSRGEDIKALAAFYQVSPYIVASLNTQNINSPVDLRGKTLGIKGGSGAEAQIVYDLLLASAGISTSDVNFKSIPLGDSEADDLLNERTDVIGFYRTRLYQFNKDGLPYSVIYPEQYGAALYNDVLVAKNDFIERNEDIIESFIKATKKGWNYAFKNKEEAVAITLRYAREGIYKDIDYERYILSQSEELMSPDGNHKKIGEMKDEDWKRFYDTLTTRNFLESEFNYKDAFTNKFLK